MLPALRQIWKRVEEVRMAREYEKKRFRTAAEIDADLAAVDLDLDLDYELDHRILREILGSLRANRIRVRLAVIGKYAEKYSASIEEAVEDGHLILNHSYNHPPLFHCCPPRDAIADLLHCHQILKGLVSGRPFGFRAPHFGIVPKWWLVRHIYPVLRDLGLYDSSELGREPYRELGVLVIPIPREINPYQYHFFKMYDPARKVFCPYPLESEVL